MPTEIKSARDALVEIVNKLEPIVTYMKPSEEDGLSTVYAACKPIYDIAQAALAAPPRNCEVGTEQEQQDRFREFCRHYESEGECGIGRYEAACPAFQGGRNPDCSLWWANMPYEADAQKGGAE